MGETGEIDRARQAALYEEILRERFADPELILRNAGRWEADRVAF